jgi:hypothetical protein
MSKFISSSLFKLIITFFYYFFKMFKSKFNLLNVKELFLILTIPNLSSGKSGILYLFE